MPTSKEIYQRYLKLRDSDQWASFPESFQKEIETLAKSEFQKKLDEEAKVPVKTPFDQQTPVEYEEVTPWTTLKNTAKSFGRIPNSMVSTGMSAVGGALDLAGANETARTFYDAAAQTNKQAQELLPYTFKDISMDEFKGAIDSPENFLNVGARLVAQTPEVLGSTAVLGSSGAVAGNLAKWLGKSDKVIRGLQTAGLGITSGLTSFGGLQGDAYSKTGQLPDNVENLPYAIPVALADVGIPGSMEKKFMNLFTRGAAKEVSEEALKRGFIEGGKDIAKAFIPEVIQEGSQSFSEGASKHKNLGYLPSFIAAASDPDVQRQVLTEGLTAGLLPAGGAVINRFRSNAPSILPSVNLDPQTGKDALNTISQLTGLTEEQQQELLRQKQQSQPVTNLAAIPFSPQITPFITAGGAVLPTSQQLDETLMRGMATAETNQRKGINSSLAAIDNILKQNAPDTGAKIDEITQKLTQVYDPVYVESELNKFYAQRSQSGEAQTAQPAQPAQSPIAEVTDKDQRVKWALGVMRKIADDPTNTAIPEMQKRLAFLDPAVKQKARELHQAELQAGRSQPEIQVANPRKPKISPKNYVNTEGLSGLRGKPTRIRTPRGQEVDGEFRIIEADNGRNSFHPGYSMGLQDRDTDKGTSREQIERIRDDVIPSDLITDFEGADVGAPIYGINEQDGQPEVEIGNHRDQGIREGYAFGNYDNYRNYLIKNAAAFGFNPQDVEKMHAPKLVRIRTTQLDPDSRASFANSGNNPRSMSKSAAEIAMTDSKYMGPALSQIDVSGNGEINTPANREFFRQFLRQVATPQEQNRLVTRDGSNLTQEGLNRIKNAIFAAAYNNNSLVERLADSTDERIKRVLNGMIKAASDTAQVKHEIDKGQLYDIQVADDMAKAADKLAELRTSDTSVDNYLSQGQFFDDGMTPESRLLLAVADKAKSADVIADIMTSFNQQVKSIGDPRQGNLLGDVALPSKESILDFIIQRDYPEIFAKKAAITQGPAILEKGAGESGLTKVANKIHEIQTAFSQPSVKTNRAMEAFNEAARRRQRLDSELTEADSPIFSRKTSGGQQTPSLFDWLSAREQKSAPVAKQEVPAKSAQPGQSAQPAQSAQSTQQSYPAQVRQAVLDLAGKKESGGRSDQPTSGYRVDSVNGIFVVRGPDGVAVKDFMTTNRANAEAKAEALSKETSSKVTQENSNVSFKPESNISDQTTIKQAIAETKPETETTLAKPEETIKQSVTKSVYTVKPSNGGFAIIDPEGKQFSWGTNRETIENRVSELNKPTSEAPEAAQPESGISKVVAAAKSAIEEDKKQPTPQPGKIEDFGEKISGARKHLYGMFVDKMKDVTPDDIKTEPLSKTWPVPDYEKMLQAGESEVTVSWIRALREALPLKPRQTYQLRDWLQDMTSFRKLAVDLASGKITEGDVLTAGGFSQLFRKARDIADLYKAVGHKHSLETAKIIFAEHFYKEGKKLDKSQSLWSVNFARTKTKYSNWGEDVAFGKTRAEAIEEFKKAYDAYFAKQAANEAKRKTAKSSPFTIYKYRHGPNAGKFTIGTKAGSTYIDFRSFETGKEALEFREQHSDELNAWLKKLKEIPAERGTANAPRVGADHRSGKDVTPEQFSEAFGFRGVQFGNWVEDKRRQKDLNDAYDGLMDLAGILNIPSKAISLNSELGLAFGARGIPNASAHYESDFVVINLTKESGAGSLAHEWWHALDNYFSRMSGSGIGYMTKKTSGNTPSGIRVEMFEAFKEIMAAIGKTDQINRSKKLDRFKSKDYWGTPVEYSARAFESYLVNELAQQGVRNDYLANVTSENGYDDGDTDERYPYLKKAELDIVAPAFRGFFKTVKTKETEKGVALYSRKTKSDEQFREKLLAEQKLDFRSTKSIEVCQTPEILRKVGAPDKPITIHPNVIYKAITGKHDLDIDRLWKLPSAIENPIMVFDSKTQPNSLVVVTEIRDKKNKTVIVAIHLTTTESWHKVNAIASVYGKNDEKVFLDWLQKGYGRYINMKKASEWARPLGLQLPVGNSIREASKKIVIDPGNDVKGEDNQEPDNSNAFYSQKGKRPEETKAETSKVTSEKLAELERIIADETKDERFVGAFQAMPAETLTDGAMISQILKDVFGKNLVVFKSNHPDGAFFHGTVIPSRDSKTIFIETSTDKPATIVAGHELLHLLKADAPDLYQQLTNDLEGLIKDFPTFKTRLAKLSGKATEDSTAKEELFGDFLGDQMADKAFWGKVARKNPNAFKRIAVLIQEMFAKLKNWLTKNDYGSSKFFSDIEAAQEAFSSTLANYSKRQASGTRVVANAIKSATGQRTENGGLGKVANAIKNAYSYAGQKAAGFKEAEKSGKTFAGPYDGKPRFELDDSKARWNKDALRVQKSREVALRLDQVFNHHELFKSYPDLAGIRTRINIDETVKEPMGSFIRNHYDPETRETIKPSIVVWARNLSDAKQVLLHEIQHAIQEKEGFARGGTPKQFEDESVSEARKRVANSYVKVRDDIFANASPEFRSAARLVNRAHDIKFGGGEQSEEYYQARKEFVEKFGEEAEEYLMNSDFADQALRGETNYDANGKYVFPRDRFEQYHSLAGEIEARDVEFRSDLSAQERLEYPPFESADVNPEDAIVRYSRSKKSKRTETKNPDLGSSTHQNDMQSKIGRGSRTNISDLLTAVNLTNQSSADEANDKKRKDRRDSIGRSSGNPNPTSGTDNDPELSAPRNSSEQSSVDKNSSNGKKVKFSLKN
nr:LPD5 domain-containing protein [Candidatus Riflebacteria bacterium]